MWSIYVTESDSWDLEDLILKLVRKGLKMRVEFGQYRHVAKLKRRSNACMMTLSNFSTGSINESLEKRQ